MKPVVVLDSNALHGLKALSGSDFKKALALAHAGRIRLVVPDVVVRELSRQAAKEVSDKYAANRNTANNLRTVAEEARAVGISVGQLPDPMKAPRTERADFHAAISKYLHSWDVETPDYPDLSVEDVLERDLDGRKPFAPSGKGLRDTLIWETIRQLCAALVVVPSQVV
ncbi:PIN domain-containing protein [Microbacterium marinilacus]|nr:PIN domain-containing protein [Microbacterium marinilacus]MBY0690527.1 PIN domain-containing protein [Microbacterium marinilacus]